MFSGAYGMGLAQGHAMVTAQGGTSRAAWCQVDWGGGEGERITIENEQILLQHEFQG